MVFSLVLWSMLDPWWVRIFFEKGHSGRVFSGDFISRGVSTEGL